MMILPLVKYGSSLLRKNCFDIDAGEDFVELAANMSHTLKNAEGIGLAGPQVGMLKNLFIIDTTPVKDAESVEEEVINGLIARIFQHEFDHLQGTLFIDKLSPLKKKQLKSRLREIRRGKY
jgi:peptide deformylase